MPRPHVISSVNVLLPCIQAIPEWFKQHQKSLLYELQDDYDGVKIAQQLAGELEKAQEAFLRERKEDKGVITERNHCLVRLRKFQKSVVASVQRRLQEHPDRVRILRDFQFGSPSRIRSISDAFPRLRELETSLQVHKELLKSGGQDRTARWNTRIEELKEELQQLVLDDVRENTETKQVHAQRDQAQENVAEFLKNMELAAEAILDIDEAPLLALNIMFDHWNPPRSYAEKEEHQTTREVLTSLQS